MPLCYSYQPDYFSLIDIAATEERLSCKFEQTVPKLGFLDTSSDSANLKVGSKLELPFWLVKAIYPRRNTVISIDIPKHYKEGFREVLQADSCAVVLSKWNQYYYELGMYLTRLNSAEKELITESLLKTFKTRFRLIMDWAQNPISDPSFSSQLPLLERELYLTGRKAKMQMISWLKRGSDKIEASEVIVNIMKRKRAEMEIDPQ